MSARRHKPRGREVEPLRYAGSAMKPSIHIDRALLELLEAEAADRGGSLETLVEEVLRRHLLAGSRRRPTPAGGRSPVPFLDDCDQ